MAPFFNGEAVLITARGPGKVHLLSFQSNGGIPPVIGSIQTYNAGTTRFIISHSYTFEKFAFYWEGAGEATYGVGQSLVRTQLGNGWENAALVSWGGSITTGDVYGYMAGAVNRDGQVTCFIVPDLI
ncbi:mucin-binding lectin 1 [Infundibulicybe gibba]|nr:mucin-binding lectin 1 [Infundibulicybe gibba]KAF8883960.1 mucin-binding lectin 1 [Infundibulicybe gibba]